MMQTENKQFEKITTNFILKKFENASGYGIFLYRDVDKGTTLTCVGNFLPDTKSLKFEMTGEWVKHPKHGTNFKVVSYNTIIDNTKEGYIAYLSTLDGVGKKTAEKIYDVFKEESINIIETHPEKLLNIKGITSKKARKITESYKEKNINREIINFLLPFGLSAKEIVKAINFLQIKTLEELKENPYRLCDIRGINVAVVDSIAKSIQYPENAKERLVAHAIHVLKENELDGNTAMDADTFGYKLLHSLNCRYYTTENICSYTIQLIKEGVIKHNKVSTNTKVVTYLYRTAVFNTEQKIAENIFRLSKEPVPVHKNIQQEIEKNCCASNITLDPEQLQAVIASITSSCLVITGGPGTGKTTIMKQAANYLSRHEDKQIVFMAPTGRAARRIEESTGYHASTIHSALDLRPDDMNSNKDDPVVFEDTTLFIDEFSMVDAYLANILFESIKNGCRVIIVGDVNQLQSVGAGAVLRDIINSNAIPVIRLNTVHRQTDNSMIYLNSKKIKSGDWNICEGSDFKIINSPDSISAQDKMIESYLYYVSIYGIQNVHCICPCKERTAGVYTMNKILQSKINPSKGEKEFQIGDTVYRVGDPVMHLKNNMDVSNGDIGYITRIYDDLDEGLTINVLYFGDTNLSYTMDNIDELTLAYAFTLHKAQGTEDKVIITYLSRENGKKMLKRSLPYTSITRGTEIVELHLTGDDALKLSVQNDDSIYRKTSLQYHLQKISGQFIKAS